jgi:hypothetical protein
MQYAAVVTGEYKWYSRVNRRQSDCEDVDRRFKVLGKNLSLLRMVRPRFNDVK